MIQEFFNIDPSRFSPRALDAFAKVLGQAQERRFRFVTPELLLLEICKQPEFVKYVNRYNRRAIMMAPEVLAHNLVQERVSPYEEFRLELSPEMRRVCDMLGALKLERIAPPDIIALFMELDDVGVHGFVAKYLGGDAEAVVERLRECYDGESEREGVHVPRIFATAIMGGKPLGGQGADLLGRLLKDSGLMNVLPGVEALQGKGIEVRVAGGLPVGAEEGVSSVGAEEEEAEREPWEEYVSDLTARYAGCGDLVGRDGELLRTVRCLCRRDRHHVIFVGEAGVGKSAMVRGLVRLIGDHGRVPRTLWDYRVYEVDMGAMLAGSSFHGEFERRMKSVLDGAAARGRCILYFDDFQNVMVSNGGGMAGMTAADLIKPYLEGNDLRILGCTTYREWNKFVVPNKAIVSRIEKVDVKEPSVEETISILSSGVLREYEAFHGVRFTPEAVRVAVEMSAAHIHDRFLPGKAISILDEAGVYRGANLLLNKAGKPMGARYQRVGEDVVRIILSDVCGIDAKAITGDVAQGLMDLDGRIKADIYGQNEAVESVVSSVMMSKAGLSDPEKPIASLLFVGPTGVGKTELCRTLAREMGMELVRFDMSEYTEKHTVSKMIGSPAGYVGFDEGGLLTDAVRRSPNCVLLLDEIEKAHSDIYNILLQVMDYGRLTDNRGNKVDFRGVILIMTSNAGAQFASQASVGFGGGVSRGEAMHHQLKRLFKPEFLNRLTATVVFNDMDREMAGLILDKKLRLLGERLAKKGVKMVVCPEGREYMLSRGFNPTYGAREMDRVITRELTPLLMREILFGSLKGGGKVEVGLSSEGSLSLRCVR